jgi:hypothetical protein
MLSTGSASKKAEKPLAGSGREAVARGVRKRGAMEGFMLMELGRMDPADGPPSPDPSCLGPRPDGAAGRSAARRHRLW